MELSWNEFVKETESTTIEKTYQTWVEKVGNYPDFKEFYNVCSKLNHEELMTARTTLMVHGKIKSCYKDYFLNHAKNHYYIGRYHGEKNYEKPLIAEGHVIGKPIYYHWATLMNMIPGRTGIYYLFYKGSLVYIGFSRTINKRLKNHSQDINIPFDACLWFTDFKYTIREWLDFERKMIKYWRPSLNKNYIE